MDNDEVASICFVVPNYITFNTGGAEVQVSYLVNSFLNRGWKVEVICGGKGKEYLIRNSHYFDARVKFHYYRFRSIRCLEFFSVLRLLFKSKSKVYYQRTDFALTAACAFYCRLLKRKMIYALAQDLDGVRKKYTTEFKSFIYASIVKKSIRQLDFFIIDKMIEYGKEKADKLVCQNQEQLKLVSQNFSRTGTIVPSSYPIQHVKSRPKENIMLWVGNMRPIKQAHLFMELANGMKGAGNWRFVMIGKVDDSIQIRSNKRVEVMGALSFETTQSWIERSKILINTSVSEGMPNTFIQAWLSQTVVCSLNADPDQLLSSNNLGFCFNGNLSGMKDKLSELILDDGLCYSIVEKARSYAQETFDVEKNVNQLIALIHN